MNIAIVGSRAFGNLPLVRDLVRQLPPGCSIVSGHAPGADRTAEDEAIRQGVPRLIFPADWKAYGKSAGFLRNQQIVDASDCVVAFWDGISKGTLDTIRRVREARKPFKIVGPHETGERLKQVVIWILVCSETGGSNGPSHTGSPRPEPASRRGRPVRAEVARLGDRPGRGD